MVNLSFTTNHALWGAKLLRERQVLDGLPTGKDCFFDFRPVALKRPRANSGMQRMSKSNMVRCSQSWTVVAKRPIVAKMKK